MSAEGAENRQTYYLGGGCFWCLDAVYRKLRGVTNVVSGYMGGESSTANYRDVCSGTTGHAEVVAVTFDPEVIPSDVVLDVFMASHDPTTLNRQGYDVGTQYRSVMFYETEREREEFSAALSRHEAHYDAPIVTEVSRAPAFHEAEAIHQDYYAKNPGAGYCNVIINPKLSKVRRYYASWLLEGASY